LCRKRAVSLVGLVHLVCFVYLVDLVHLMSFRQPNKLNKPNRPNEQACPAGLFSLLLVVLILGIAGTAQAQFGGSCRASAPPSRVPGTGFFEVVPSICVAERYDTNVFFRPATPGLQRDDFVTTVNPRLRINHNGEYASVLLNLSGFSETYVKNPILDFLGTRDSVVIDLDNSIKRWFPRAGLRIMDSFSYSQLPPALGSIIAGATPGDPNIIIDPNIPSSEDVFAQGLLFERRKNLINTGMVLASYDTTATTSLNASYTYSMLRFQGSPTTQGLSLFNTTSQTGTAGGTARLSDLDTVNVRYAHTETDFTRGVTSSFFKFDSTTIGWSRLLTPSLSAQVGGGGVIVSTGLTTYLANAALMMNFPNSNATLSYARSIVPSFVGAGEPQIADRLSLSATQMVARQWRVAESVSYVHTSRAGGNNGLTFDALIAGGDIQYWMTSIWAASLSYNYTKFTRESGSINTDFDRHVIMLSIIASWG
jgi:hypothetical protein